jgi:hypothetical protein
MALIACRVNTNERGYAVAASYSKPDVFSWYALPHCRTWQTAYLLRLCYGHSQETGSNRSRSLVKYHGRAYDVSSLSPSRLCDCTFPRDRHAASHANQGAYYHKLIPTRSCWDRNCLLKRAYLLYSPGTSRPFATRALRRVWADVLPNSRSIFTS